MALRLKNRVKETTTTTGTGTITVSGTAPTGFQTFASALADGDTTYYQLTDGTDWEIGLGTWDETAGTLARTTIFESSNSNSAVNWGAGSKDVFIVMPAEKVSGTTSYSATSDLPLTANQVGDQAFVTANNNLYIWSGSGWYRIATVNQTPTVSGNSATYELATDGTATVVTMTGTDPEGFALTWSATESGDTGIATTTNVDNVFTVTPVTSGSGGTMTVTFAASDGVNTGTANSTFTLNFVAALWPDVTLSIGTSDTNSLDNETFIDRSSNALTVTSTNDPLQTAFHPYLNNWGSFHKGASRAGGYFYTNYTSQTGTSGDWTAELWFYRQYTEELYCRPISIESGASNALETWGNSVFELKGTFAGLNGSGYKSSDTDLDKWHHIALARESGTLRLFIDGELAASGSNTADINLGDIVFGAVDRAGGYALNKGSRLADIRIVNGTAVYTSAFTPPTEPLTEITNTIFMWNGKNWKDTSSNNRDITAVETSTRILRIDAFNPYAQDSEYDVGANKGSVYLATGDEVVISHDSAISAGTGDFCLQFWVYASSGDNASYKGLVSKYSGGAGGIWLQPLSGVLQVGFSTSVLGTGTKNVMDNGWHHIAWTRSGSANKVFVDGEQEISFTASDNLNNTVDMLIGDMGTLGRNFQGYVADLKYDVGNAVYTSAFTPPTSPVGNTNADLYLPMDNAGIFDRTGNFRLEPEGNAATSTTQYKFGSTAMYFDGTGDYVTIPDDNRFDFHGDFTVEMWVYSTGTATTANQTIIGGNGSGSNGWTIYSTQGSETVNFFHTTFRIQSAAGDLPRNQWVHLAVCRSGSTTKMFVDGTEVGTEYTGSETFEQGSANVGTRIGWDIGANGYFTGYLDNLQILNGVAKYTSNFTAPTAEQGRIFQAED